MQGKRTRVVKQLQTKWAPRVTRIHCMVGMTFQTLLCLLYVFILLIFYISLYSLLCLLYVFIVLIYDISLYSLLCLLYVFIVLISDIPLNSLFCSYGCFL